MTYECRVLGQKLGYDTHELFYPPSFSHKAWYVPFKITCINKSNQVEIKDHTRWLAKVPVTPSLNYLFYLII